MNNKQKQNQEPEGDLSFETRGFIIQKRTQSENGQLQDDLCDRVIPKPETHFGFRKGRQGKVGPVGDQVQDPVTEYESSQKQSPIFIFLKHVTSFTDLYSGL